MLHELREGLNDRGFSCCRRSDETDDFFPSPSSLSRVMVQVGHDYSAPVDHILGAIDTQFTVSQDLAD